MVDVAVSALERVVTGPGRRRIRSGAVAVVLLVAGCAGPRNTLNTATSHCFRALPLARDTVHEQGKLVGVRAVRATRLTPRIPQAERLGAQRLCLVAFKGPYTVDAIPRSDPAGPGTYAIVAVDSRGSTVLASFVVNDLPLRFRHLR